MLIEVKQILPDGTMIIKFIKFTGEFPEKMPEEGKKCICYFEEVVKEEEDDFSDAVDS